MYNNYTTTPGAILFNLEVRELGQELDILVQEYWELV